MGKTVFNSYGGLFNDCATGCEVYTACGGFRHTAPCGCAWPLGNEMRKKCDECYILCRERPGFTTSVSEGRLIEQVSVKHSELIQLPLFIPINTHDYQGANSVLPIHWVAADLRIIFNLKKELPGTLKPHFRTIETTREYLRVDSRCQLIAVLNGKDKFLESFWGMDRVRAFNRLSELGFSVGTGPTYSVSNLTPLGTPTPYAHHAAMLMRHHQVVYELQNTGLCAVPNLYWLDGDQQEINRWGEWLGRNPLLRFVSKDFTLAGRNTETVSTKINDLLKILKIAGRSFHVLIVGTGPANAPAILRTLYESGHSASVITSAPIFKALRNRRYRLSSDGRIFDEEPSSQSVGFHEIILHNMRVFEEALVVAAGDLANVNPSSYNLLAP